MIMRPVWLGKRLKTTNKATRTRRRRADALKEMKGELGGLWILGDFEVLPINFESIRVVLPFYQPRDYERFIQEIRRAYYEDRWRYVRWVRVQPVSPAPVLVNAAEVATPQEAQVAACTMLQHPYNEVASKPEWLNPKEDTL